MPRGLVRYQQAHTFHFITFSCYRRKPLLNSKPAYECFERHLEAVRQQFHFAVIGYVLMPEHVHMLVSEPKSDPLAIALQVLKQETSRELDKHSKAQFWQRRYYDFNVWSEEKAQEKLRYMHRNPVRRGLAANPEDWPWSSFRHYATGMPGTIEIESERTARKRQQNTSTLRNRSN